MRTGPEAPRAAATVALRAEHDALAARLAARRSVDVARKALLQIFVGLVSVGLTVKLAWDRWGVLKPGVPRVHHAGPPLFLWIAMAFTIVLLVLAIRSFSKARRLMRKEEALFTRYRQLRETLGLDR